MYMNMQWKKASEKIYKYFKSIGLASLHLTYSLAHTLQTRSFIQFIKFRILDLNNY